MKKLVLASIVASVFAGQAVAAINPKEGTQFDAAEVQKAVSDYMQKNDITVVEGNGTIVDKTGHSIGKVEMGEDGSLEISRYKQHDRNDGRPVEVEATAKITPIGEDQVEISGTDFPNPNPNPVIDDSEKVDPRDQDISNNNNRINDIEAAGFSAVAALEQQYTELNNRIDKLDQRMDGVMAGTHAINNARPFVQNGQTAFGVGTGFAGSAQAVAVGFAHSFEDSAWSMSATTNISTGSKIKTEASFGAGVQYAF